jgi:hypothetical protein
LQANRFAQTRCALKTAFVEGGVLERRAERSIYVVSSRIGHWSE